MQSDDRIDRICGRQETATRLNIHPRTLFRLEQSGAIKRTQITTKKYGFTDSEIDRFIRERTGAAR